MLQVTCPHCNATYDTEIHKIEPNIKYSEAQCINCEKIYAFEYCFKPVLVSTQKLEPTIFPLSVGDLVIRKGKSQAKSYFVEYVDEYSVLLVNGIRDELYSDEEDSIGDENLDYFYHNFRLLAKKENLLPE